MVIEGLGATGWAVDLRYRDGRGDCGEAVVTTAQIAALRLIFMKAGLEFGLESDGGTEVSLKKADQNDGTT